MRTKVSFLMRTGLAGWSETYLNTVGGFGNLQLAMVDALALLDIRRRLSPDDVVFQAVRVSDIDFPRAVQLERVEQLGTFPSTVDTVPTALVDMPWTAIRVRFGSVTGDSRLIYLRGVPDALDDYTTGTMVNPAWRSRFDTLVARLILRGYGGVSKKRGSFAAHAIEGMEPGDTGIVIFAEDHGLTTGNKIRISGNLSSDPVNGTWIVTVRDEVSFVLRGTRRTTDPITVLQLGRFWRYSESNWEASTINLAGFGKRNVGRPFGLYRGRKSRKPSTRLLVS